MVAMSFKAAEPHATKPGFLLANLCHTEGMKEIVSWAVIETRRCCPKFHHLLHQNLSYIIHCHLHTRESASMNVLKVHIHVHCMSKLNLLSTYMQWLRVHVGLTRRASPEEMPLSS